MRTFKIQVMMMSNLKRYLENISKANVHITPAIVDHLKSQKREEIDIKEHKLKEEYCYEHFLD